ncbi:hypothetical protein N9C16_09430 [Paracoccaceae bacterium]|nr:hypothetical protein [Paracoccaceae bacterium]
MVDSGTPGRMFDASLERLSVTETSYNNILAERAPRSTVQTLPTTLPEPRSKARGPRSLTKKTSGARAAIGDSRSQLMTFCKLALVGLRGPRALGHVCSKRLAAQSYGCTEVTAPNPHTSRATAHRPAPLQAVARSKRRG